MKVPLFDLDMGEEEEVAVIEALRSKWLSMGARTAAFEEAFAAALGVPHAIAVTNGTAALHLAMLAVGGIGPGDEVIVPALTFVATANAARYVGATPVFADIRGEHDLNIDPESIEAAITPRTKAIVVMHYAGFPCDMARVAELAEKRGLKIIEDACHGLLSEHASRKLGTIGHAGCFSFFANKNMTTAEGGMVVTSDAEIAARVRLLRSHGMTSLSYDRARGHTTGYDVLCLGYNYRMDDMRAALGLVQLKKLHEDRMARARLRRLYEQSLAALEEVVVPFNNTSSEARSNYIMPIVISNAADTRRDAIRLSLASKGVQTSVHYPAIHRFSALADESVRLPRTEQVADSEITLPLFKTMTEAQVDHVVASLQEALAA